MLGESVVGVVQGVAEGETLTWLTAVLGVLGIALAFGMWWLYFDFVARRRAKPGVWWGSLWTYLHLPFVMATAAVGAGVLNVIANERVAVPAEGRWLIAGAVAVSLITLGALELVLHRDQTEPTRQLVSSPLKLMTGLAALTLGLWGTALGAVSLLSLLLLLVIVNMVYGAVVWFWQTTLEPVEGA